MQKICCSPYFVLFSCLVVAIIFSRVSILYTPYYHYLYGTADTKTYYVLTNAVVQCGERSSQQYTGINIRGYLKPGDSLQGSFNAWLVPEDELILYS